MKASVAERQAKTAKYLLGKLKCAVNLDIEYTETKSTGSGITLWAMFSKYNELNSENPIILSADSLGARGKRSEKIGEEAAMQLIKEINSGGCTDSHLADQLLPFLALFGGRLIPSKITEHCKSKEIFMLLTNFWVQGSRLAGKKYQPELFRYPILPGNGVFNGNG